MNSPCLRHWSSSNYAVFFGCCYYCYLSGREVWMRRLLTTIVAAAVAEIETALVFELATWLMLIGRVGCCLLRYLVETLVLWIV